jgi:hypothetical protein
MFGIIASNRIRESYSPELKAIINRAKTEGFTLPSKPTLQATDVLIQQMIADGYWQKRDSFFNFAYNQQNLINFTRINWINPTGSLGEFVNPFYNILGGTNNFNSRYWALLGITANTNTLETTSPIGDNTASKITTTLNGTGLRIVTSYLPIKEGNKYNISFYLKQGNRTQPILFGSDGNGASFNVVNNTFTLLGNGQNAQIDDVGNGWYRYSVAFTAGSSRRPVWTFNSEIGSFMYAWGIQLTAGVDLKPFQETDDDDFGNLEMNNEGIRGTCNWNTARPPICYFDTNFNPTINGSNYTLNNAGRDFVVFDLGNGNNTFESSNFGSINRTRLQASGTNVSINNGSTNLSTAIDLSNLGYKGVNRINSNDITIIDRNVLFNDNRVSTVLPNGNQILISADNRQHAGGMMCYGIGASVVTEGQNFRTAYNTYLTSIGLSPIA